MGVKAGENWVPIFDGKTKTGWHTYGGKTAGAAWKVTEGTLYLDKSGEQGEERNDLVTDRAFGDFHLRLEWKMSAGGNSGVLFYVQDDPEKYKYTWMSGPEVQLLDNVRHSDADIPKRRASDLYDLIESRHTNVKPAGSWNLTEISCIQGELRIYLNGAVVIETTLWDKHWQELIASSKFRDIPGYGTYRSGKIALQDHGDDVWFRNIRIREL